MGTAVCEVNAFEVNLFTSLSVSICVLHSLSYLFVISFSKCVRETSDLMTLVPAASVLEKLGKAVIIWYVLP